MRSRQVIGPGHPQESDARPRQRDPHCRRADSQQSAFGEEVADHTSSRGAERRPHRQLPAPAGDARDQEIRRVRARDDPDEGHGSKREAGDRLDVTHHVRAQIHHAPRRLLVLIRHFPQRKHAAVDRLQLTSRGRSFGFTAQAAERRDEKRTLTRRRGPPRYRKKLLALLERADVLRQHPGEHVVGAVESNGFADDVAAAAKPLLPEAVADNDRQRAAGPAICRGERSAEHRRDAEHVEVGPRHDPAPQQFGGRAVVVGHRSALVSGDLGEVRLLRFERQVVGNREREFERRRVGVDAHETAGIRVRERPEERRVDRAEDRRRGADAQADRDQDRQRQHRNADQAPKRDLEVLHQFLEEQSALHVRLLLQVLRSTVLPREFEVAELPNRLTARLVRRQTARHQFLDAHL